MDPSYLNFLSTVFSPPSLNVLFDKNWVIFKKTPDGSLSKILKLLSANIKSFARSWFNTPQSTIAVSDVEPRYNSEENTSALFRATHVRAFSASTFIAAV